MCLREYCSKLLSSAFTHQQMPWCSMNPKTISVHLQKTVMAIKRIATSNIYIYKSFYEPQIHLSIVCNNDNNKVHQSLTRDIFS